MRLRSLAAFRLLYGVAVAGMAAWILYSSSPGAVVSRSYAAYNGRALVSHPDITFPDVQLPYSTPLQPVSATEAKNIQNGYILFAYPACPFCRNLLPVLADVASQQNITIYYCKLDDYRDKFAFNPATNQPEKIISEKDGYLALLDWLSDYLDDYTVNDPNGNSIPVGEKRIMAPTLIAVKDGNPLSKWQLSAVAEVKEANEANGAYAPWDAALQGKVSDALLQYLAG